MITLETLDRAAEGFSSVLSQVDAEQWQLPTGNEGRDVGDLVDHVIGGNRMSSAILAGGSREEGLAQFARSATDVDRVTAFEESRREMAAAFAVDGALDRMVEHPSMSMPGAQLLGFRLTEYALHGWDLAQAIGADYSIDPQVADVLWEVLEPMAGMMAASGMFGEGPSGTVPADAPVEVRILDLSGRRP